MDIDLTWLDGGSAIRLDRPFTLGRAIVPAGFVSDGTSRPWILSLYVRRFGACLPAALIHDHRYRTHDITRRESDDEFWANLILHCGVRSTKATACWFGLRIGGWWAWRKSWQRELTS